MIKLKQKILEHNHFKVGCCSPLSAGFPLTPDSLKGNQKIQTYHRFIEAAKFANGQKRSISDPLFNNRKVGIYFIIIRTKDIIRKTS